MEKKLLAIIKSYASRKKITLIDEPYESFCMLKRPPKRFQAAFFKSINQHGKINGETVIIVINLSGKITHCSAEQILEKHQKQGSYQITLQGITCDFI